MLITDSMQFYGEQPKLKDRDNRLMKNVVEKIRKGGNVLIPCDSAGRVLELMRVLDQYWLQIKYVVILKFELLMLVDCVIRLCCCMI